MIAATIGTSEAVVDTYRTDDPRYMGDYGGPNGADLAHLDSLIGRLKSQGDARMIYRIMDWDMVERALAAYREKLASTG
jgi:hypothetical protein